jgi:Tfp pilus assembly protein PilE
MDGGVAVSTRGGHSLVELMLVVAVLMVFSATVMIIYGHALEAARVARTKTQVAKIEIIISELWENYETRRVRITTNHRMFQHVQRINALRELMRLELPDRKSDVIDDPVTPGLSRPAVSQYYLRQVPEDARDWSTTYQGAECLYLILQSQRSGAAESAARLRSASSGDKDNDGMQEIHDAWGNPIEFLRWAPGFKSPRQTCNTVTDPDPLDPFHIFPETYALYPLIYSAGADESYHLTSDIGGSQLRYSRTFPPNNPYVATIYFVGSPMPNKSGFVDNFHNHDQLR